MTSAIKVNNETASDFLIGRHRGIYTLFKQERKYRNHFEQRLFLMCVYLAHKLELYDRGKSRFVNIMLLSCPPVARGAFWSRTNSKTLSCCGVSAPTDVIYNHYEIGHGPVDRTKCFTCRRRKSQGNHANCAESPTDRVDDQFVEKMRIFIRTIGEHYLSLSRVVTTKSRKRHLTAAYVAPKWDLWWELKAQAVKGGFEFHDEEHLDWSGYLAGLSIEYRLTSPSVADRLGTPSSYREDAASSLPADTCAFGDLVAITNDGDDGNDNSCVLVRAGLYTLDHDGVKVLQLEDGTCRTAAVVEVAAEQNCISTRQPTDKDDDDDAGNVDGHERPKRARVSPRLQVRDDVTPAVSWATPAPTYSYSVFIDPMYKIVDEISPMAGPATATAVKRPNPTDTNSFPVPATTMTTFTHLTMTTTTTPTTTTTATTTSAATIEQLTILSSTAVTATAIMPLSPMVTSTGVVESEAAVTTVEDQEMTTTTTTTTTTTDTADSIVSRVPNELFELLDLVSECDLTTTTTTNVRREEVPEAETVDVCISDTFTSTTDSMTTTTTTTNNDTDTDTTMIETLNVDMNLTDDMILSTSEHPDVEYFIIDPIDMQHVVTCTPLVNGASSSFEPTTTTTTTTTHTAVVPTVVEVTASYNDDNEVDTSELTEDELLYKLHNHWHNVIYKDDPRAKFEKFSRMLMTWIESSRKPVAPPSPTIVSLLSSICKYDSAEFMESRNLQKFASVSPDSSQWLQNAMCDAMSDILFTLRMWVCKR